MSKPQIEIVSHCYAAEMPQYAAMLHYQLSSLLLFPPQRCEVWFSLIFTDEDKHTLDLLRAFNRRADDCYSENVLFSYVQVCPGMLFRRSIARNMQALNTLADVIWMTDVDHIFGPGCLDALGDLIAVGETSEFMRVKRLQVNRTHALGDASLARVNQTSAFTPLELNPYDFEERRERRPIGGLQIMRQDLAHRIGYLNDSEKWQKPVDPEGGFRQCKCDVAFRKTTPQAVPVNLPNLFRIRHSHAGRDGGKKDHSKK